jgi:transposase
MTEAILLAPVNRGRQTKFTPERIRQITNLVERGKSRDEIAEIIGVTPATFQVTCSRLKISLRRPSYDPGNGLFRQRRKRVPEEVNLHQRDENAKSSEQMEENLEGPSNIPASEVVSEETIKPSAPQFGIRMHYKGENRTIELPLSADMIGRVAIEAEFRNTRIGELVAQLILGIVERDLFKLVLDRRS